MELGEEVVTGEWGSDSTAEREPVAGSLAREVIA